MNFVFAGCLLAQWELDTAISKSVTQVASAVAPSVVRIETVGGAETALETQSGISTGTIISNEGLIMTNALAVAHRPTGISVRFSTGKRVSARLLGVDHVLSLALLRVEENSTIPIKNRMSDSVQVGQYVVAVGNTLADQPNLSLGIVSAKNRVWGVALQTDAKVSPANYGGPLVDLEGRALGILVSISPHDSDAAAGVPFYDSGIGFAIPWELVLQTVQHLKTGDRHRGLLGFNVRDSDPLAEPVIVDLLAWKSPAKIAGVQRGDILVLAQQKPVHRMADFRHVVGRIYSGDEIELKTRRGNEQRTVKIKAVEKLPEYHRPFFGIVPEFIHGKIAVKSIVDQSPAAHVGLKPGDLLATWNKTKASHEAIEESLSELEAGDAVTVSLDNGKEIKIVSERFPIKWPSLVLPPKRKPAVLIHSKENPSLWRIKPSAPRHRVIWIGEKPSPDWLVEAERFGLEIASSADPSVMQWFANKPSRGKHVAVLGPGADAENFARQFERHFLTIVAVGGPLEPRPAQPYFPLSYLIIPVKNGTPVALQAQSMRNEGIPIMLGPTLESPMPTASLAETLFRWLELLRAW